MPLIYNSLECEHMPVQEKVLKLVPHLCEILDYGTVQNVLLVNVAVRYILSCEAVLAKSIDLVHQD
jgi:SCY1-like protein 2